VNLYQKEKLFSPIYLFFFVDYFGGAQQRYKILP